MSETALLGLGANLGDRLDSLQRAVDMLGDDPSIRIVACSRVWETDPVGRVEQPDFLNVVVRAEVRLDPRELLAACHRVETALGRVRETRWGPRTIDIDILLYGGRTIDEPDLSVPHPRMLERAFVLLPLLELDPDPIMPDGSRVLDLALGPDAAGAARPFAPPLCLG